MTLRVPFLELRREALAYLPSLQEVVGEVARSGLVLFGPQLEAFERELAAWHGVAHAVGVASGTDAIEVALRATGDCEGSATLPALTAVPTINAVEAAGFRPVLVDVDPLTRNAPEADVHVHLFGLATQAVSARVEDAAHSLGARVGRALAGTMGRAGALSFYPTKILGAFGDGGAVITDDPEVARRAREIRHYGFDPEGSDVPGRGLNSRLGEIQAALLRLKLRDVERLIDKRRLIAERYRQELEGRVILPTELKGCRHVYQYFVIEHPERDRLRRGLELRGIGTAVHYPKALHGYSRWRPLGSPGSFPVAEKLAQTALSLPCYPFLRREEQAAVVNAMRELT